MRAFFRLLFTLNHKYDRLREPWRMLVFIGPIILMGIVGGFVVLFATNEIISMFANFSYFIGVMFLAAFRFPVVFLNKEWVYTYSVGIRYKFPHKVEFEFDIKKRTEIAKWAKDNFTFYHGKMNGGGPNLGKAIFYFLKDSDAMAFKLRWL